MPAAVNVQQHSPRSPARTSPPVRPALAHVLYEGARSDMKTFADFLKPVRRRLLEMTGQPDRLTLVFDAGSSSRRNLEGMQHYVKAVRPSSHLTLLEEAAGKLAPVPLASGGSARAWRGQNHRAIQQPFSPTAIVNNQYNADGSLNTARLTAANAWLWRCHRRATDADDSGSDQIYVLRSGY
jgi:hypothetical protein